MDQISNPPRPTITESQHLYADKPRQGSSVLGSHRCSAENKNDVYFKLIGKM